MILFFIFAVVFLLAKITKKERIFHYAQMVKFNVIFSCVYIVYLNVLVFGFLQFKNSKFNPEGSISQVNLVFAGIFFILISVLHFLGIRAAYKNKNSMNVDRYKMLWAG